MMPIDRFKFCLVRAIEHVKGFRAMLCVWWQQSIYNYIYLERLHGIKILRAP